jgi:hypothetical protein
VLPHPSESVITEGNRNMQMLDADEPRVPDDAQRAASPQSAANGPAEPASPSLQSILTPANPTDEQVGSTQRPAALSWQQLLWDIVYGSWGVTLRATLVGIVVLSAVLAVIALLAHDLGAGLGTLITTGFGGAATATIYRQRHKPRKRG